MRRGRFDGRRRARPGGRISLAADPARVAVMGFPMGENDTIVPVEFAQRLYDAVGSKNKTLRVLTVHGGGSAHCQEDNRQVGANIVADGLKENL